MKYSLLSSLAFILTTVPITRANLLDQRQATLARADKHGVSREDTVVRSYGPATDQRPCCFPYRFQAVITGLRDFGPGTKEVSRLYRNWDRRMQVQESVEFSSEGIQRSLGKTIMDFKNMVQYVFTPGRPCQITPITYGMFEPCMPENAIYLGKSYIGFNQEMTPFNVWTFKRTNLNRDVEFTVVVTSDGCVPVMERITGSVDGGQIDVLALFTNVTKQVPEAHFSVPMDCLKPYVM